VSILNSRRPETLGTRIVAEPVPCANIAKSIACRRNITLVNISSTRMLMGLLEPNYRLPMVPASPENLMKMAAVAEQIGISNMRSVPLAG